MKIWKLDMDVNHYEIYTNKYDEDKEKLHSDCRFTGTSVKDRWKPIEIEILWNSKKKGDGASLCSTIKLLNEKAILILQEFLTDVTEILPVIYSKETYYAINVIQVLEGAIDYSKAKCERFSDNRIMCFDVYAFHPDVVKNKHIFKIKEFPNSAIFVSDAFRNKAIESGLTGFDFVEVWDSEKSNENNNQKENSAKQESNSILPSEKSTTVEVKSNPNAQRMNKLFNEYKGKYSLFHKKVMPQIQFYDYTDEEKYSILPAYFERGFCGRGKSVNQMDASYIYGFNNQKQLLFMQEANFEHFLIAEHDKVTLLAYDLKNNHTLNEIVTVRLSNAGNPVEAVSIHKNGYIQTETYQYDENHKITEIKNPIGFGFGASENVLHIKYGKDGVISEVTADKTWLENNIVYKRIDEKKALELEKTIADRLYTNIVKGVTDTYVESNSRLQRIALESQEDPHGILSLIYVRTEVEDTSENTDLDKEFDIYDTDLKQDCNLLVQYYMSNGDWFEDCCNIIKQIIDRLRSYPWSQVLKTTEDFTVLDCEIYD